MKKFFEKYSYISVKLLLNQAAIAIFGVALYLAASKMDVTALKIGVSVFSVLFFLFLQFTVAYKTGTEDRVSIDLGKAKADYLIPLWLWLLSNSLNLILAVLVMLSHLFGDIGFFASIGSVSRIIVYLFEGMYTGILAIKIGEVTLFSNWIMYFVITLPALLVIYISYIVGVKSKKIAKIFEYQYPESDRPEKKKKKKG